MKRYLVGGAVRDQLLGYPVKERDWVVVGATPRELLDLGYTQVGKDFPVFLHPETREEYALARTERKSGHGYSGFDVHAAPNVTLEEDLLRRDLTVNAIAMDDAGNLVDPYGGQKDLQDRVLRHVSTAFSEDPLRILRVARFAARYATLGFKVASDTNDLMQTMTQSGELSYLPTERVWVEMERALREASPQVFIRQLRACGALAALLPEVDVLFGVPQRAEHHPEIDTGEHTLLVLAQAARVSGQSDVAFAALTHDLGKAITPEHILPSHRGHEHFGLPLVSQLCERLRVPNVHRQLALVVCEHHLNAHRCRELKASTLLAMLETCGALRQGNQFQHFVLACEADARGRQGYADQAYPQADYLRQAAEIIRAVSASDVSSELSGRAVGDAIRQERLSRLKKHKLARS